MVWRWWWYGDGDSFGPNVGRPLVYCWSPPRRPGFVCVVVLRECDEIVVVLLLVSAAAGGDKIRYCGGGGQLVWELEGLAYR